MPPLGIYVQVPFCQTKCTYCNFHTGVVSASRFAPYIDAVCAEVRQHEALEERAGVMVREDLRALAVDSVYIGGGTPSLLDPVHIANLLRTVRETFSCYSGDDSSAVSCEVTLEADPETIDPHKAAAWVSAGVNRVSFGLQSFIDKELIASGRMHRRADIYRAVPVLRAAGISNIGFDLIAGLPHQTAASWRQSLDELANLQPEHVSIYLLEIDEGSRLGLEVLQGGSRYSARDIPSEDDMATFYQSGQEYLQAVGYHHYEISNWAKARYESRHNLKYWRRKPYLGFGAGAHSFVAGNRWANAHDAANYVKAIESARLPIEQHEVLSADRALEEELFLGLRQLDGIDVSKIERDYGVQLASRFDPLAKRGLLERAGNVVRLAPQRLSISNEVFVELMR
ncbi:MAG: radical SAM family heme chaperone HemW [Candidatus Acidiferrum sp.]|jgi:oxygen-independent coproporphyrinogen-3 oxidase